MRLIGKNRASAPWFLNRVGVRRRKLGMSATWTNEKFIPASDPHWNKYAMRPDEFHPCRRLNAGARHEYVKES